MVQPSLVQLFGCVPQLEPTDEPRVRMNCASLCASPFGTALNRADWYPSPHQHSVESAPPASEGGTRSEHSSVNRRPGWHLSTHSYSVESTPPVSAGRVTTGSTARTAWNFGTACVRLRWVPRNTGHTAYRPAWYTGRLDGRCTLFKQSDELGSRRTVAH